MSPWPMMNEWGIPTFYLQSLACEFAGKLVKKGYRSLISQWQVVSPMTRVFKALAMGSPYFRAVAMGRGLMIPGMVGKNIRKWIKEGDLPKSVSRFGTTIPEIFVCYEELKEKYGNVSMRFPLAPWEFTHIPEIRTGSSRSWQAAGTSGSQPSPART